GFNHYENVTQKVCVSLRHLGRRKRADQPRLDRAFTRRFRYYNQSFFQGFSSSVVNLRSDGQPSPRSIRFASSQCSSISSSETSDHALPCSAILFSTWPNRRRNLRFVDFSALSGSTPYQRARLAMTKRMSPISPAMASLLTSPRAISSRSSRISS